MALSLSELQDRRDLLQRAKFSPAQRVVFADGTSTLYKTDAEISADLAAVDAEIAGLQLDSAPRFLRTSLRSGYTG